MKYDLKKMMSIIDADWCEENPSTAFELIQALIVEYYHMKDVIELQREELLLLKAITLDS